MSESKIYQAPSITEIGTVAEETAGHTKPGKKLDAAFKKGTKKANLTYAY